MLSSPTRLIATDTKACYRSLISKKLMKKSNLNRLFENREALRWSLLQAPRTTYHIVELVSSDKCLASANFFLIDKAKKLEPAQALVALLSIELHFYEEWELDETTEKNVDLIIDHWLLKSCDHLKFQEISSTSALAEIRDTSNAIIRHLALRDRSRPAQGGIYIDTVKTEDFPLHLLSSSTTSALGIFSHWNEREIFYETSTHFVLFSWSTSA